MARPKSTACGLIGGGYEISYPPLFHYKQGFFPYFMHTKMLDKMAKIWLNPLFGAKSVLQADIAD